MHRLGLPQERIANRLSVPKRTLSDHLAKMPSLAIPLNADWPARHRSRPKEAVSAPQGFRSGEAGGRDFQNTPAKKTPLPKMRPG